MKKAKGIKKLKKTKKGFFRARNIVIAVTLLLTVCLSAYFFVSCKDKDADEPTLESIHEQASTMLQTPTDGTVPSDYDAKTNAYYAVYAMNSLTSFTTESSGETVTKVALVSVKQQIRGSRVVNGDEIYKENLSHSTFKGVGVKTFVKGDNYIVHNANTVNSIDDMTWDETASRISKDDYMNKYGFVANNITGYVLTDETIISAEYLGEENGIYSYSYDLDVVKATGKLALEMRTMAGSESLPVFEKASIIIRMNSSWQVTEVVTSSVYKVDLLGGVTCTESVSEKFSNYNQGVSIPNAEFYNSYVDAEITETKPEELTATDYLMKAFSDYVSGTKPLKAQISLSSAEQTLSANLDAEIGLNLEDLKNTTVKINANSLSYGEINLENLFLSLNNGNIYLKAGEFKAVTNMEEISAILDKVSSLSGTDLTASLGALGSLDLEGLDFTSLISGATMQDCGDYVSIALPLSLGEINVNANLIITKGDNVSLSKITANLNGMDVVVTINDSISLPNVTEDYNSLSHLLDFIDENGNIKAQLNLGEITCALNFNVKTLELDAYVSDLALGDVSLGDVKLKLKDGIVYAEVKGLKVKLAISDVEKVLSKISSISNGKLAMPDFSAITDIDVTSILVGAISSLTATENENELILNTNVLGYSVNAILSITENGYKLKGASLNVNETQVSLNVYDGEVNSITSDLSEFSDILPILSVVDENNEINLTVNAFDMDIDLCFNLSDLSLIAKTELYGETLYAKLVDSKVYLSYKGLNAYADLNDIDKVLAKLESIIGKVELPDFSDISIESIINSLTVTETDVITIATTFNGIDISLVLNKANGLEVSGVNVKLEDTIITATPSNKADYSGMNATNYYNIVTLLDLIENNEINLTVNAFDMDIDLCVNLVDFTILAKTELFGETLYAKLADNKVYLSYKGLNVYADLSDIQTVLSKLEPLTGKIELPDFSNISLDSILSSLTVSDSDVITIALDINGISLSVVLNKTNGLTLSKVSATIDELDITATPSSRKDFSGMTATNYYNIVTLLDLIENNEINLTVNALDLDIDLCFNLSDLSLIAKTELYGETLYAKLVDNKVYLSYKGLNAYADLSDIDKVLAKLESIIGKVELPDFSDISIESIINSLTVTETDVITIATTFNGIDISLVLNKANGLEVSSVNVKLEDTTITATPSNKADYSGMNATNYYNIVTLLDIIDAEGNIPLALSFGETQILANINLASKEIFATLDGLEIYLDLNEKVIYARYPGVQLKLSLSDLNYVLNELDPILEKFLGEDGLGVDLSSIDFDTMLDIDVESLIKSITVTNAGSSLKLSLSISGTEIFVNLTQNKDGIKLENAEISVADTLISIAPYGNAFSLSFDKEQKYIDLKEVVGSLSPALRSILFSGTLSANMSATIVSENTVIEISDCKVELTDIYTAPRVNATLTLTITKTNADGSTTTTTHKIRLVYLDPSLVNEGAPNVYFTYDNTNNTEILEGTFTTVKANETLEILKQIYAYIPELQEMLKPLIIPNEKEEPTLAEISIDLLNLFGLIDFENDTLYAEINGNALTQALTNYFIVSIIPNAEGLLLNVSDVRLGNNIINVNIGVGVPTDNSITDETFNFTVSENASDFSSINELLLCLKNTAKERHFHITGKVDMTGIVDLVDCVYLDVQIDVNEKGKTYVNAKIDRLPYSVLGINAWKDYKGTGHLYYDPETEMIYIHNEYVVETKEWNWKQFKYIYTYTDHDEYLKYTVDEFMADPMTPILKLIRLNSTFEKMITDELAKENTNVSTATVENTLLKYSYNGKDTFTINLDLEPLTKDIRKTNVIITHDNDMNLTGLNVDVGVIGILTLKLDADLETSQNSYGADVVVKEQASSQNYN